MKQYDPLKKKLRGYSVEVDKEKLWQQTVHAIPQKKKRRPLVIPFLFGVLLLSGGLAYNHFVVPSQQDENHLIELTQANTENTSLVSNNFDHSAKKTPDEKNKLIYNENEPNHPQAPQSFPRDPQQKDQYIESEVDQPLLLSFDTPASTNLENLADADAKYAIVPASKKIHWSTTLLDALSISPITSNTDPEIKGIHSSSITPGKPYKNVFSIALLQGVGFTNLSFDAGNSQAEEMQEFLTAATRSLESISTTMRGNIQFTKGLAVSAGVAFHRLTTETNYQNAVTTRMEKEGTTTVIIDELGHQQLVSGSIGTTHILETDYTRYTTHQTVDVELTLHKRIFGFHRTTVNGYLKAGVNLHYSAEGSSFTSEYELVRFDEANNPYSLKSPFTYGFGLDVQHRLSPSWILVGTAGIDQLNVHHQDYSQLQWQHMIYAFSLGVGYVL